MNVRYIIISPARNEQRYIEKTIRSVILQTIRPFEWIIVNDGSTDNTEDIIKRYSQNHPWIQLINKPDRGFRKLGGGVIEAFNTGYNLMKDIDYDFIMGTSNDDRMLSIGEEDIVWVDIINENATLNENDVVKLKVYAEADAIYNKKFEFDNSTSNFFVKKSEPANIKIVRENSKVVYNETTGVDDAYLEVKNIGKTPVVLNKFYVNSLDNEFTTKKYLEGSSIIETNQSVSVYLPNSPVPFSMIGGNNIIGKINTIGVITKNNITDSTIFTSNLKTDILDYQLCINPQERIFSPELYTANNPT